jgi:hypothetical protein
MESRHMADHATLIDALSAEAGPVRRVSPPWVRALLWAPLALGLGYLATNLVHRAGTDWADPLAIVAAANIVVSLTLGVAAFIAALSVSIPGGRVRAKGWIAGGVAVWLALALFSISISGDPRGALGEGSYCFTFVVTAGLPMVLVGILALRRTRSLKPVRSLTLAGMGSAFLSFGLLAFCHPVELSAMDFTAHIVAGGLLGGIAVLLGRRIVALSQARIR